MALTRDFKETVVARVKSDPAFAQALLDEALTLLLNGEPEEAKLILRDLVNATIGFEGLAEELHKPSKSLHRMLSRSGNPTLENFSAVLVSIRKALHVDIRAVVSPATAEFRNLPPRRSRADSRDSKKSQRASTARRSPAERCG